MSGKGSRRRPGTIPDGAWERVFKVAQAYQKRWLKQPTLMQIFNLHRKRASR